MKVKEIDRTANIAWSPAHHHPIYLAAGTAAQQLDATFSTTAALEIYSLNLTEPGLDMALKGSVVSDYRFHKVVWGCGDMKTSENSSGILVGGADGGNIMIYDPEKLLEGESALLHHKTKHTGPVHSLDFNKFQPCLLASGASDSEIFIWDLNNPTTPMTPGAKSQPSEEVTCVAWNCQVQHILASTFPARCVVWDLRKNEPIIKVSDSTARLRCKMLAWHPEVATQLCLASEDDHCPLIQLWDLRFATSPLKTLEHHQRGVLSIAWCPQDPDLLLSCGKDNRILCWNPNSDAENGEVVCELPTSNQWSFDVAWCPRNPAVIASSSFDGHVSVFSLMGGQQQAQCSSKIAESFPGSDKFIQPHIPQSSQRHVSISLRKPPKWLRKPVGASFGFGGKLVSFINEVPASAGQPVIRSVYVSQVVTEPELLNKSAKLESALSTGNLAEFCQNKVATCENKYDRMAWNFLQATFDPSPRTKMLSLLGYDPQVVASEVATMITQDGSKACLGEADDLATKMSEITTSEECVISGDSSFAFDTIAAKAKQSETPLVIHTDKDAADGLLCQALLTGNIEAAVEICLQEKRWADALVLSQSGGSQLLQKTQNLYFEAIVTDSSRLISSVVMSDWSKVVKYCDIDCWKEGLAAILTYAKPDEFASLCELLGGRLEVEKDGTLVQNALLCYICSGNLERLSQCWVKTFGKSSMFSSLQGLVEQVMILRRAVEQLTGQTPLLQTGTLSSLLGQYAALLAAQGSLSSAVTYLVDSNEETLAVLRDRICQSLGLQSQTPFQQIEVKGVTPVPQRRQSQPLPQEPKQVYQPQVQQQQYPSYGSSVPSVPTSGYYNSTSSNVAPRYPPVPNSNIASSMPLSTPVSTGPPVPDSTSQSAGKGSMSHHLSQKYPRHVHDPSVYSENTFQNQFYQPSAFATSQPQVNYSQQANPSSYYSTEQDSVPAYSIGNSVPPYSIGSSVPAYSVGSSVPAYPVGSSVPAYSFASSVPAYSIASSVPAYSVASSVPSYNNPGPYGTYNTITPTISNPAPLPNAPMIPSFEDSKPGWNDPPLLKTYGQKPPVSTYDTPAPITTPLVGAPATDMGPPQMQTVAPGNYFIPSFPPQAQVQPQLQTQQQLQPLVPLQNMGGNASLPPQSISHMAAQVAAEPPKEKGPIPPEHQVLQDIFEDLRQQCQQVATNPQTKRKLEDVAKKLENLYDRLREDMLSQTVILSLHQIIQAVQQSDYQGALLVHSQLVSTANFSEISGFMPSIKVLLQTASQLGVYLQ